MLIRLIVDIREDASEFGVGRTRSIKALFFGLTFGRREFRVSGLRVVEALFFGLAFGAREFRVGGLRVVGALFSGLTFGTRGFVVGRLRLTFGRREFQIGRLRVVGALFRRFIVGARELGVGRIRERRGVFPRFLFAELVGRRPAVSLALRRRVRLLPGGGDFVRWRSTLRYQISTTSAVPRRRLCASLARCRGDAYLWRARRRHARRRGLAIACPTSGAPSSAWPC